MQTRPASQSSLVLLFSIALVLMTLLALWSAHAAYAADEEIHVVVPGDTLSEIAAVHGTAIETLRRLNDLPDTRIRVGQRLVIPSDSTQDAAQPLRDATPQLGRPYIVLPGDTLSGLAQQYNTTEADLVALNNGIELQLKIGEQIQAPLQRHVVQPGDQLGRIAARYATSVAALLEVNRIANPRLIVPGQILLIPAPSTSAAQMDAPASLQLPNGVAGTTKWIDVDLSKQLVVAYEGAQAIRSFTVSTGLPGTPTVTGTFRIRIKTSIQDMYGGNRASGDYYYLKDVPWVQYFFEDYAFHGTWWHTNFGRPASRGCVNMTIADAAWLFDWAGPTYAPDGPLWQSATADNPGTLVVVHE